MLIVPIGTSGRQQILRTHWQCGASAVVKYLSVADYYATSPGELLGRGFDHLDISGKSARDVFECLAHNLDPATGHVLRKHAKEGDRVGMDFTFNAPKSVSLAREMAGNRNGGDERVEQAHREAVAYAMGHIEADMQTRVRVGGADHDRTTGNLMGYRVTHRDTRINANDQMPDPHLHDHVLVLNITYDPVEQKFKAAQLGQVKHDAPFYEAIYMNRLAANLRDLGYGVRRAGKSFEIAGIERPLIEKFSRRSEYIKDVASKLGITNPETKDKLGATTRLGKTKETVDDLNGYFVSRLTGDERKALQTLEGKPSYTCTEEKAVRYAIGHEFERRSVVEERKLYETALRHGIGSVTVEGVQAEAKRQGVLLKDRDATTKNVLDEESRIIHFAREGRGTMRPLGSALVSQGQNATPPPLGQQKGRPDESRWPLARSSQPVANTATLNPEPQAVSSAARGTQEKAPARTGVDSLSREQSALVNHILTSPDQVVFVIGDAGTGKTKSVRAAFDSIHCPVEMLAPSATASRDVLRKEGFQNADTVASFLLSPERQAKVRNGVIWVDEAGLLPIRDMSRLTDIAKEQHARLILQGDPKQHRSVVRHGNMLNVLQEYGGLPVGRLSEIWRQKHQGYKRVVADIAAGDRSGAFDGLAYLGWVQKVEDNKPLVDDFMAGAKAGKEQLIVAPTHVEADEITAAIRARLKQDGKLGEEHEIKQLVNLNWTAAEKDDRERYEGSEVLVFHRNSGTFRAGDVVRIADFKTDSKWKSGEHFSVFREDKLAVAAGDTIRITANGKTKDGHGLSNGAVYRVKGFDKQGNLLISNGWTVGADFRHVAHGYVSTSPGSQGKTVDRVLIAMGSESRGAINAEQFYVSVSRGRESAKVYTDMAAEELKKVIERTDARRSATEMMKPKRKQTKVKRFMDKVRRYYKQLREQTADVIREKTRQPEKEHEHAR